MALIVGESSNLQPNAGSTHIRYGSKWLQEGCGNMPGTITSNLPGNKSISSPPFTLRKPQSVLDFNALRTKSVIQEQKKMFAVGF